MSAKLGRSKTNFRLWQDQEAIAFGKQWESEIKTAVEQAVFFISIVTPRAVNSHHCKLEFEAFLAREHALGRTDLIFPLLYIKVPALENEARWRQDPVLSIIGSRQYVHWQPFLYLDIDTTAVRTAIGRFCDRIVEALRQPWVSPEERRKQQEIEAKQRAEEEKQRAEVARRTEEEKRRAVAARLAEEKRQRAETARLAEEERQRAEAAQQAQQANADLAAADWRTRLSAVTVLTQQMRGSDTIIEEAARSTMQSHLQHEGDVAVRASIINALAEDAKRRAEVARQAEEEKRRAKAARQAEEHPLPLRLSVIGVVPALLGLLILTMPSMLMALLASATIFAVRSNRKWPAYLLIGLNPLLALLCVVAAATATRGAGAYALCSLTFMIQSVATFIHFRRHPSKVDSLAMGPRS